MKRRDKYELYIYELYMSILRDKYESKKEDDFYVSIGRDFAKSTNIAEKRIAQTVILENCVDSRKK